MRSDTLVRTQSRVTACLLEIGTLLVLSFSRYYHEDLQPSGSSHPWVPAQEEVTTSISFIPSKRQALQQMVRITSRQSFRGDGVLSSIPILEVNRVLPAESPVFSIVREGRLDDFIALLRNGRASLKDHDEYGASLLHVSPPPYASRVFI